MYSVRIFLLLSLISFALGAPSGQTPNLAVRQTSGNGSETDQPGSYNCLKGTSFPAVADWKSFDELKTINQPSMGKDAQNVLKAIQSFSTPNQAILNTNQFHALILAQVMQETGGTATLVGDSGESHGLLQVKLQNGESPVSCAPSGCTYSDILKMLQQGINGHSGNGAPQAPGIGYWLGQTQGVGPALRSYNTGSVPDPSNLSVASQYSTESYVSDVGNRLNGIGPEDFPTKEWLRDNCGFKIPQT
ncbi:MAG: hypothetical protein Q9167_002185 [Letrouitia subvulpina]